MTNNMKTRVMIFAALIAVAMVCCKKDNKSEPGPVTPVEPVEPHAPSKVERAPQWKVDWSSHDEAPDWKVADKDKDITSTMNIIVMPSDNIAEADIMAAFCNDVCVGVCKPKETAFGMRFYLGIYRPKSDNQMIKLAYFDSSNSRIIYWVDEFRFTNDDVKGLASDPYIPNEANRVSGEKVMVFRYSLPEDVTVIAGDELALFAGESCRALLPLDPDATTRFVYEVKVPVAGDVEEMYVKYYSASKSNVYKFKSYRFVLAEKTLSATPLEWAE